MERQYGEFINVDNLHYASVDADTTLAYTAGTPTYLAPTAEIAGEPEVNNVTTYYDGKAANNYVTEGKTELKITVSNVPAQLAAYLLGKDYDAVSGRVYDSGAPNPPDLALGFRFAMGQSDYRYYWFHKGTFSGGAEEAASKKSDIDIKTYQLTYTAVTTTHEFSVIGSSKSLKRVYADTADDAFDPSGWFEEVQTPSTTSAPNAVALSTISPADGATAISKTADIVITFNNKIATESIVLLDSSSGDVKAVTKAWDATGKILTMSPATAMSGTTMYIVSVAGVVDVYGQVLAATGKDFTTTA